MQTKDKDLGQSLGASAASGTALSPSGSSREGVSPTAPLQSTDAVPFTPGPWMLANHLARGTIPGIGEGRLAASIYVKTDGRPMIRVGAPGEDDETAIFANARLIAAAPDQNALIAEALDLIPRMSDDDPIAPALADWCHRARAVQRKVRGDA